MEKINILDDEGYPTDEYLDFIRGYKPGDDVSFIDFINIIKDSWWMSEWGFILRRRYGGKRRLELHTGGWSGNEMIIGAIKSNMYLTHFKMRYVMWKAGGHYYFDIYE